MSDFKVVGSALSGLWFTSWAEREGFSDEASARRAAEAAQAENDSQSRAEVEICRYTVFSPNGQVLYRTRPKLYRDQDKRRIDARRRIKARDESYKRCGVYLEGIV